MSHRGGGGFSGGQGAGSASMSAGGPASPSALGNILRGIAQAGQGTVNAIGQIWDSGPLPRAALGLAAGILFVGAGAGLVSAYGIIGMSNFTFRLMAFNLLRPNSFQIATEICDGVFPGPISNPSIWTFGGWATETSLEKIFGFRF